ncbi:tetratricopeptide repeat protein [Maioricimonas rarisocia]|uniref:Tetratricopeptide repeat protein n=1 Tax=Maioricimonas rarisocia TaxID=2528026 RepID=A0A517ZEK0_9PLAN|nr:CRTAC1 family protein [Maioricimonas rarisocia]QDU40886.1 tetratricopeptide repeat protein [Maioricimonas rarisocia]
MRNGLLFLLALLVCGCSESPPAPSPLATAHAALARGELLEARKAAVTIAKGEPDWPAAQMLLGDISMRLGDSDQAREYFEKVPRDDTPLAIAAAGAVGSLQQQAGQLHEAIGSFRYVVEHQPANSAARKELANLHSVTGQRALADQHLFELARSGSLDFRHMVQLTDFERRHPGDLEYLQDCAAAFPDDPAINLGLAIEDVGQADLESARQRLEMVVERDPQIARAQGLLGELLLEEGDAALQQWHRELPESVHDAPEVWYTRGVWARSRGRDDIAARCFWEAARQVPHSHRMMNQLGQVAMSVDPARGRVISLRAREIYELRQNLSDALNSRGGDQASMRAVIETLMQHGREWEAWHWAGFASGIYDGSLWVEEVLRQLAEYPDTTAPRIVEDKNLLLENDLSSLPGIDLLIDAEVPKSPGEAGGRIPVRFTDQAGELRIDFVYHQGRVEGIDGVRMQESTGGGVGVIDFDNDGLPDLFLTQGEDWNAESDRPAPSPAFFDRLFRNRGDRFGDVTALARIPEEGGFGQGVAAGDFNNDGFVDLYVANIGVNQLLINEGDGTFTDVTAELGLTSAEWTASCLIADLNNDGHPDLFDVNYVEGEQLFRMICDENQCSPEAYTSSVDELHLSTGNGGLQTISLEEEERGGGAGLAVVAFRLDVAPPDADEAGQEVARQEPAEGPVHAESDLLVGAHPNRLSLFVANDHEPNFFLTNAPSDAPGNIELTEQSFLSGLAVNSDGKPTACMGVASGDANGDGRLDLFVSNYRGEANNLYLQNAAGYFSDDIAGSGLLAAGLPFVGWGTQFLDADNDGDLDLMVTNGHVGDFQKEGGAYYMPTQFFGNLGGGRFQQHPPEQVGAYFSKKQLGRSLATLDWNRDGRVDVAISAIGSPAALLTNETEQTGRFLALRLHAVSTARDAIGAVVTVTTSRGTTRQQLTGGDGYLVTNERVLRFGLGETETIDQIDIEWPGGTVQTIEDVPADVLLEVVEGSPHTTVWRGMTASRLEAVEK